MPGDPALAAELRAAGRDRQIASVRRLEGGFAAGAWLVTYSDGTRAVGKTLPGAPRDLFAVEAEGLAALAATGRLRTPEILCVTERLLLLGFLPAREDSTTCTQEVLGTEAAPSY